MDGATFVACVQGCAAACIKLLANRANGHLCHQRCAQAYQAGRLKFTIPMSATLEYPGMRRWTKSSDGNVLGGYTLTEEGRGC